MQTVTTCCHKQKFITEQQVHLNQLDLIKYCSLFILVVVVVIEACCFAQLHDYSLYQWYFSRVFRLFHKTAARHVF